MTKGAKPIKKSFGASRIDRASEGKKETSKALDRKLNCTIEKSILQKLHVYCAIRL